MKNNPIFISKHGIGKTSIAEGLTQHIVNRDVPASLICPACSLNMGALLAGATYRGVYKERIKSLLDKVKIAAGDGGPGIINASRLANPRWRIIGLASYCES
jgi:ATP-dependent Clp protease ATP-binding subunit ClpA